MGPGHCSLAVAVGHGAHLGKLHQPPFERLHFEFCRRAQCVLANLEMALWQKGAGWSAVATGESVTLSDGE